MRLSPDQRQQLRSMHPDALLLRVKGLPEHEFVFRQARIAEMDAFLSAVNGQDGDAKVHAHRTLASDLLLFPSVEEWNAFATEKPGFAHTIGHEVSQRAGLGAEVQVETL